jgi:hypothetical protein
LIPPFRNLTDKALRRGVFHSVDDLVTAIEDYLKHYSSGFTIGVVPVAVSALGF